jgi:hypothetical protein
MGIARRKAGTVVRCPSCASQVTVPLVEREEEEVQPRKQKDVSAPIFERSDFDEIFAPVPSPAAARRQRPEASPFTFDVPEAPPAPELVDVYKKPEVPAPVPPAPPAPSAPAPEKNPVPASPPTENAPARPGIWLTPGLATLLSVAAVVALALAFAGGLLLGIYMAHQAHEDQSRGRVFVPLIASFSLD